jgi:hypothetical protein
MELNTKENGEHQMEGYQPKPCSRCGRTLRNWESVQRGIGPICAKRAEKDAAQTSAPSLNETIKEESAGNNVEALPPAVCNEVSHPEADTPLIDASVKKPAEVDLVAR